MVQPGDIEDADGRNTYRPIYNPLHPKPVNVSECVLPRLFLIFAFAEETWVRNIELTRQADTMASAYSSLLRSLARYYSTIQTAIVVITAQMNEVRSPPNFTSKPLSTELYHVDLIAKTLPD